MRSLTYFLAFAVAFLSASIAAAVNIDFDLSSGTFISNPPPEFGPPDSYHSNPITFDPFTIDPGEMGGIWVTFKDMMHLEVIDTPSNSDGVERLRTHVNGRVVGDPGGAAELWIDVILSGASGHIRESFPDPTDPHPDRPPLGTPDGGTSTGGRGGQNDELIGDWDGAYDDSGTDIWDLFHEDVRVDAENHLVFDVFTLETLGDDLTDDNYLFHDIHWEITNHGNLPVEIRNVEFWQDGNIVQRGVWIPEPSSVVLGVMGLAGLGLHVRRRRD